MDSLLLRDVRPMGGAAVDVLVRDGLIVAMGANLPPEHGLPVEDGSGALLLPGLVESHAHLDKTLWGLPWYRNEVGPRLLDRINNERRYRAASGHDAGKQAMALALAFLARGTTRIRTHVDIDTDAGLKHLEGMLATREKLRGLLDMQLVAFPQSGLLVRPRTADLLREALRGGADVLGGLDPQEIDGDREASLDQLFALAQQAGCPIDIHLHESGEGGALTLSMLLDRVQALGLQGRVAVSHAFCLGDVPAARRDALLERMAKLEVAVVTSGSPSRPVPSLQACRAAGVAVAAGNDGIRDTWTPYGQPDMLERAMLVGMRNNLRRDDEVEMALDSVTAMGARVCGFAGYGLAPGCVADLVLVQADTLAQAVVERPTRDLVVSRGRVVARKGSIEASATMRASRRHPGA